MATSTALLFSVFLLGTIVAQDQLSSIGDWAKLLKLVNDIGLSLLSDSRDMNILGYQCHYTREAGWHKWELKYKGTITCASIEPVFIRGGCRSKGCAWKEPFMQLIRDFIANNRAPKDGLVGAIQASELSVSEKQSLLILAG